MVTYTDLVLVLGGEGRLAAVGFLLRDERVGFSMCFCKFEIRDLDLGFLMSREILSHEFLLCTKFGKFNV